jgi:hypothetical protein
MTTTRDDRAEVPTERLRDPGSDRGRCVLQPPPPLWAVGTTTTWTGWPAACRPPATGPSWRQRCAGRWRRCLCWGETGGGAGTGRLAEFLAGVRRTSIEAGRYKAGWTRLSAGGRKRRAAAVAAGPGTGSLGRGVSSGVAKTAMAGDWTTGRPCGGCPPVVFRRGGSLLPPLVDRHDP